MTTRTYTGENVLNAAKRRVAWLFDEFEQVVVSISGGKDSTVLAHLALQEARARGRKVGFLFVDAEAVFQATIDQVEYLFSLDKEHITPYWFQIPYAITNAASIDEPAFVAWDEARKNDWMRPQKPDAIHRAPWSRKTTVKDMLKGLAERDIMANFERMRADAASLVGLRADESLNRQRAVAKKPGYKGVFWSTARHGQATSFYPIYDWQVDDVWHYISQEGLRYNAYYDYAFKKGVSPHKMRVSSLVNNWAFKDMSEAPEFEPETYQKLLLRTKGVDLARALGQDKAMFRCVALPASYHTWREYRDFLLKTYRNPVLLGVFRKRFEGQPENEATFRKQCKQLVLGDYENHFPVERTEGNGKDKILNEWVNEL